MNAAPEASPQMNAAPEAAPLLTTHEERRQLAQQWRGLTRAATVVALLTSPAAYMIFHREVGWGVLPSIAAALGSVIAFRGLIDLGVRKLIPWPSLFGVEEAGLREEDVVNRRRAWHWRWWFVAAIWLLVLNTIIWAVYQSSNNPPSWAGTAGKVAHSIGTVLPLVALLPIYLLFNFVILMGPLLIMGISQIRGFEPGDADWGVRLDHVRGQAEAKEEVRRVVNLWQSGEAFEKAGGKRERGILFHGPPGTGKTMLAKAIATGFNAPIVTIPGSGFAQAQPLDAKILTPDGWTTMGAIAVGDEVIDPEGGTARVSGVFPQGTRDIYRVTFSDGSSTECDLEHLWQVRRHRYRPWRVETLRSIKERLERDSRQNRPYIPLVQNLEFEERELPLDPYLLGVLLGDGCFTGGTPPRLIAAEPELVGAAAARLPAGMWAHEDRGKPGAYYLTAGKRGSATNELTNTLKSLVLYGHGALTKFVPDVYKYASADTRLEVLRGLMDTDGHVRQDERSEAVFATSSSALADDVVFLVRSLGGTATKRATGKGSYRHPVHGERPAAPGWHVQIALGPDCNPFRLSRKRDGWTRAWEPSRRIVSIEKVGRKRAQCIKLDSDNELYVTDDFIVTHNTFIGMDAVIVRFLARKAKKLAAKWGGQCIVFIDEIDAVGMRRAALGPAGGGSMTPPSIYDYSFFGPYGALNPTGDLILETRAWRDKLFAYRNPDSPQRPPGRLRAIVNQFPGGMFGGGMGQLALNQLLVVMDGIDNPPWSKRFVVNKVNKWLDASYIVPRRVGRVSMRLPHVRPTNNQIYFIGATNVPINMLDPALTRPGRMGRHVWFRTPTKKDRQDIFDLYLGKVAHDPDLDRPERRDELARITSGYSPAMVEQVCSMALTYAHHEFKERFAWEHITEAMVTVESGTAVGVEYIPEETRAVAIHEAGHAVTAHVYMKGAESTRLSIRMRGGSLGHHQALEKDERFSSWRNEEMGHLVWTLGAMAAENVFYGQNATGVGGDLHAATTRAGFMVGVSGMGPDHPQLNGGFKNDIEREKAERRIMKRFEEIGNQLMNRSGAGGPADVEHNPVGAVLGDHHKRTLAAQILGQAYVQAYNTVRANKDATERVADTLVERKELYGDELVGLLDSCKLKKPEIDLTAEETWPTL
jgi:ATP-dependent Zn protease